MALDNFRTQKIIWDRANKKIFENIEANSGDSNGRKLVVQVINQEVTEELSGTTLSLGWKSRNGAKGLDAFNLVDASKGVFEIYYTTEMLSNIGNLEASLILIDATGRIESSTFTISIRPSTVDDESIESENSFTALTEALVRVNDFDAQLAETKQEAFRKRELEDLSSEVLSAIEGGEGTTFNLESIPQDRSVSYEKQRFISADTESVLLNKDYTVDATPYYAPWWLNYSIGGLVGAPSNRSLIYEIPKNAKRMTIRTEGNHDRFVVGLVNEVFHGAVSNILYTGKDGDGKSTGNETYSFTLPSGHYKYLVIGIHSASAAYPVFIDVYEKDIHLATEGYVDSKVVDIQETDDVARYTSNISEVDVSEYAESFWYNSTYNRLERTSYKRSNIYAIPPESTVKIETHGVHNRFNVALIPMIEGGARGVLLYAGKNGDNTSDGFETFTFKNTNYKYVVIGMSTTGTSTPVSLTITEIVELATTKYVDKMGTSSLTGIGKTKEVYPVMFGVKMSNERDASKGYSEAPRPLGWLYYVPEEPYRILYADGTPENMKHLCNWKKEVTWNGVSTPDQYRPFITKDGDIIFVWRGDVLGLGGNIPNVRQNPIVYPAGDYDNPVEVALGDEKPTAWLQNSGADYLYNQDVFIFSEYTRPSHLSSYVWRVTKPFTNPDNWVIVKDFPLSGSNNDGMKHCHTINFDTYSERVYLTTGDDNSAAKIFESSDYGETWNIVLEGNRRQARVLNFIFTKEKVYWANDDSSHGFFSVDRDENGIPDFTNVTELYDLRGHPPTYVNALIEEPYGILILNRYDGATTNPLSVLFWDIENQKMHDIKKIYSADGLPRTFGFRVEAANFYHSKGDNKIVVGFGTPNNDMAVLNNGIYEDNIDRINNLVLEVVESGETYDLNISAVSDRT